MVLPIYLAPPLGGEQTDKTNLKQIINIVRILSRKALVLAAKLVSIHLYGKSLEIFSEPREDGQLPILVWALLKGEHFVPNQDRVDYWARQYLRDHLQRLMCGWSEGYNG